MSANAAVTDSIRSALAACLPADALLTDPETLTLYGQDVSGANAPVQFVARPTTTEELATLVRIAGDHSVALVQRGGGMSYSSGYVCEAGNVLCLDLANMNQVLDVNTEDMTVTVQAGCTWKHLYETLEPLGVRTPFWGTLSGVHATVGGGLSQNSIFWGSGRHGSAVDSVISFDIVLASGDVLSTGTASQQNASPFFRHFGPDLTGLFTCDTGALGIKATATLKLLPATPGHAYVSADFQDHASIIAAISEVSRQNLAEASFAFDPTLQGQRMKRESLLSDVKALGNVVSKQSSMLKGIKEGVKVAVAGRGFMKDVKWSVHFMIEEATDAAASAGAARVRQIVSDNSGREIENSIPKITRANPFGPVNSMIGPAGERWLPVHGLVPHSKALETFEAIEGIIKLNEAVMTQHEILTGYLLTSIGTSCFVIEPVFYWPDALGELHRHSVDDDVLAKINAFPDNPEARGHVMRIRGDVMACFKDIGASHLQIGRAYPYQEGLSELPRELVGEIKRLLDPQGRMNPGSLGL